MPGQQWLCVASGLLTAADLGSPLVAATSPVTRGTVAPLTPLPAAGLATAQADMAELDA